MAHKIKTQKEWGLGAPLESTELNEMAIADRYWRMNNLYYVLNEQGKNVKFKMRPLQEHFYRNMWWRNILLKSRQVGGCVDPNTKVLTADLKWIRIADLNIGDEVVACDEYPAGGKSIGRKMRTAKVQGVIKYEADERVKITMTDGRILICTPNHPWLTKKSGRGPVSWRSVDNTRSVSQGKIEVGDRIRSVTDETWEEPSYEDGYVGGCIDSDVYRAEIGRMADQFKLMGMCRPEKIKNSRFWEGREFPGKRNPDNTAWNTIQSIENIGPGQVVDLQTSTKTYVAEGMISHNTTLIELLGLDSATFISNFRVVVIAHKKDDAANILETKAMHPYLNMHPELRERVPLIEANKTTMRFANGSSVEVTTSGRSGTAQFLHISEFGWTAAKRPDAAREILSGSLPGIHDGAMAFIESTAEGSEGLFFDLCQTASNMKKESKQLAATDFKFHFYGWWQKESNRLSESDAALVEISNRNALYFHELQQKHGIVTDDRQRAWYVSQMGILQQMMLKENPSTPEEAFQSSGEGLILQMQMSQAREDSRITDVAPVSGIPVDLYFDIGLNDETAVWFGQDVGTYTNLIKYMEGTDDGMEVWVPRLRNVAKDRGWNIRNWVGPHDLKRRGSFSGDTLWDEIAKMGVRFQVVPKVGDKGTSIQKLRTNFSRLRFDQTECEDGIKHADNYRWQFDSNLGTWKDKPRHDRASNGADALQTWAMWNDKIARDSRMMSQARPDTRRNPNRKRMGAYT